MDKLFHPILYMACDYLSMLKLKLIHVGKRGPMSLEQVGHYFTDTIFKYIFSYENCCTLIQISLILVGMFMKFRSSVCNRLEKKCNDQDEI